MRFEFVRCASIPRLGWCAHLRRGSAIACVYHGPWVETHEQWFAEGAWTGSFESGEIDSALFNVGSGGVIREGRAVFCTQTDMIERLYSLRSDPNLFISNSLVFVLAMAGDELDPCYPFYEKELREHRHEGIRREHKPLPTRLGQQLDLHNHCQVAVTDDLRMVRIEKPLFPPPASYGEYVSMLEGVLGGVLENAASPRRRHRRYTGLATVSGGYDANALATLLQRLGVREAITFYNRFPGDDSGEEVARLLGMAVRVYGRHAFRTTPDVDEAEFVSWPNRGHDVVLAPCEAQLVGRVLVTGRYGDTVLGCNPSKKLSDFRLGRSEVNTNAGAGMLEFRLRVGFLQFNPFYVGGLHLSAIHRITMSQEMEPWRLGGDYDRPIARRIIEEGGVPRGTFGVNKSASAYYQFRSPADMSPAGHASFESYRRSMPRPRPLRHGWHRGLVTARARFTKIAKTIRSSWWTGGTIAESLIPVPWRYQHYDEMDFAMHWGQARVRERYAEATMALAGAKARKASAVIE